MRVQDGAGRAPTGDLEMEGGLGRRPAGPTARHAAGLVDLEDVAGVERALVGGARRDRQPEGIASEDDAEIPAGAHDPAPLVEAATDGDQPVGGWRLRGSRPGTSRSTDAWHLRSDLSVLGDRG